MTSAFSPPTDRRVAAEFLRAVIDDNGALMALSLRADKDQAYRDQLIAGLALSLVDRLVAAHGRAGALELLDSDLWDTALESAGE